eukprot:5575720-Prymnesium_polylepis.1
MSSEIRCAVVLSRVPVVSSAKGGFQPGGGMIRATPNLHADYAHTELACSRLDEKASLCWPMVSPQCT